MESKVSVIEHYENPNDKKSRVWLRVFLFKFTSELGKSFHFIEHYHKNGNVKKRGNEVNGIRTGYWEYFRSNGHLKLRGNFINDFPHGMWEWFDTSGNLWRKRNYINGFVDGDWIICNNDSSVSKLSNSRRLGSLNDMDIRGLNLTINHLS